MRDDLRCDSQALKFPSVNLRRIVGSRHFLVLAAAAPSRRGLLFLLTFFFFRASEYSEGSSHWIFPVGSVEPSHFGQPGDAAGRSLSDDL